MKRINVTKSSMPSYDEYCKMIKPNIDTIKPQSKFFFNEFIYCKPGVFDHFEGFEELKNSGAIDDYYLFKCKGAKFDSVENSGDRVGGFTVCADTEEELYKKHNEIVKNIKVIG